MKPRIDIKAQAKVNFNKQYWMCVLAFALYTVIPGVLSGATAGIAALLLMPPVTVGYAYFCLRVYRDETCDIVESFTLGFKDYGKSLVGILWMYLFTFLWSLLFIIPGIVKAIAYSMTPYILAEQGGRFRERRPEGFDGNDRRAQGRDIRYDALIHRLVDSIRPDVRHPGDLLYGGPTWRQALRGFTKNSRRTRPLKEFAGYNSAEAQHARSSGVLGFCYNRLIGILIKQWKMSRFLHTGFTNGNYALGNLGKE